MTISLVLKSGFHQSSLAVPHFEENLIQTFQIYEINIFADASSFKVNHQSYNHKLVYVIYTNIDCKNSIFIQINTHTHTQNLGSGLEVRHEVWGYYKL